MTHRIEITFTGNAPDDEMSRAHILADLQVTTAIEALSNALQATGFAHEVNARTVRTPAKRTRPALAAAAE